MQRVHDRRLYPLFEGNTVRGEKDPGQDLIFVLIRRVRSLLVIKLRKLSFEHQLAQ
ncbi:MAG: hypothetical protein SFY70_03105 [Bacteroidia bacterium]|nr:hypothetical protein [Bacteroidia bacterium]